MFVGRNECEVCTITDEDTDCSFKIHRREKAPPMFKRNDIEYHSSPKVPCKRTSPNLLSPTPNRSQEIGSEDGSSTDVRVRNLSAASLRDKLPLSDKGKNLSFIVGTSVNHQGCRYHLCHR